MKAKLVKIHDQFFLYNAEDILVATTEESPYERISMKNCQAIERGYDLDELAKENYHKFWSVVDESEMLDHTFGYVEGFQKALELMGDKKFSEDDIVSCFYEGKYGDWGTAGDYIQSLQQKEWEVEICCYVEEDNDSDSFTSPMLTNTGKPKLDADGCLILKPRNQ